MRVSIHETTMTPKQKLDNYWLEITPKDISEVKKAFIKVRACTNDMLYRELRKIRRLS